MAGGGMVAIAGETDMLLKELPVGARARVIGFTEAGGAYRRKLLVLGMTPGVEMEVVRVAPMGDPVEIHVRGSALTLRKEEANVLNVEKL